MYEHFVHSCRSLRNSALKKERFTVQHCSKRAVIVDTTCAQESLHGIESVLKQFSSMEYVPYGYSVHKQPRLRLESRNSWYIIGNVVEILEPQNCRRFFHDKRSLPALAAMIRSRDILQC